MELADQGAAKRKEDDMDDNSKLRDAYLEQPENGMGEKNKLLEIFSKSYEDVEFGRIALIKDTFRDLRKIMETQKI